MESKLFKKAILPSVLALGAAMASMTTVTYAWFTSGSQAKVNDIDLSVESATGLQIGIDNYDKGSDTFSSFASVASLNYTGIYGSDYKMKPLSSVGGTDSNGNLEFYDVTMNEQVAYSPIVAITKQSISTTRKENKFVMFDLYVENAGTDKDINISSSEVLAMGSGLGTELSARIAFVNEGTYDASSKKFVADESLKVNGSYVTIYEPNAIHHTANGLAKYNLEREAGSTHGQTAAEGSAAPTFACASELTTSQSKSLYRYVADSTYLQDAGTLTADGSTFFKVKADKITNIRVFIWVEGQDIDCLNDVAGTQFKVKLQFNATAAA